VLFSPASSVRSWPYQTCTEWGFYQTCELGSRCPFTQGYNNLTQSVAMCQLMFGIKEDAVQEQVKFIGWFMRFLWFMWFVCQLLFGLLAQLITLAALPGLYDSSRNRWTTPTATTAATPPPGPASSSPTETWTPGTG
jgi:hypothetical protein